MSNSSGKIDIAAVSFFLILVLYSQKFDKKIGLEK